MSDGEFEAGVFQGKVLQALASIEVTLTNIADRLDGHSRRLGSLERWRSWIAGGLAAGGVVVGWLLKVWTG